jgi:hypothetical protein
VTFVAPSNECVVASKFPLIVFCMSSSGTFLFRLVRRFAMSSMWIELCAYAVAQCSLCGRGKISIKDDFKSDERDLLLIPRHFLGAANCPTCPSKTVSYNLGRSAVIIQKIIRLSIRLRCELRCLSGASSPKISRPVSLGGALSIRS